MEPHSYIRHMSTIGPQGIQAFITKWEVSGAAERANAQLFIAELCDVIGVEPPRPKTPGHGIRGTKGWDTPC
jgi:hypothetical protein